MSNVAFRLENVTVSYGAHKALHDVSGTFHVGSLTAIAGPNGAGKSTLLKVIAGIIRQHGGTILYEGVERQKIGYLPQSTSINRDFPVTVLQTVCTGFLRQAGGARPINAVMLAEAGAALARVGLAGFEHRLISELSGGEFQRLLFGRLIVQNAQAILLDEPFTAIDAATTARLINLMMEWHREGRTIICVLHDLLLIQKYFPDAFVLAGKCLGHGHTHKMLEQKLLSFDLDMAELCAGPETPIHAQHLQDTFTNKAFEKLSANIPVSNNPVSNNSVPNDPQVLAPDQMSGFSAEQKAANCQQTADQKHQHGPHCRHNHDHS